MRKYYRILGFLNLEWKVNICIPILMLITNTIDDCLPAAFYIAQGEGSEVWNKTKKQTCNKHQLWEILKVWI
jgi:hypothetical protein